MAGEANAFGSGELYGYAVRYLSRHVWRVRPEWELDDLLQESYLLLLRLQERYGDASPMRFMAIWKRSLRNWVNNLAGRRTAHREVALPCIIDGPSELDLNQGCRLQSRCERSRTMGYPKLVQAANCHLPAWERHEQEAPGEVRQLLHQVHIGRKRPHRVERRTGRRLTTNEYLCRYAKVLPGIPLRKMFNVWLEGFHTKIESEIV